MLSDKTREFMSRVVPWPGAQTAPGYVDLVWAPGFNGKPFKSLDEFMKLADWANRKETIKDLYYCLSLQAEAAKNHRGGLVAKRHASLALSLKSIWLDIDVKDPPKGYTNLAEALDALQAFRIAADLPPPSALVHSGGGLHVYWISDRALSKAEWEPYAQGLKALAVKHELRCDAGLTTDAARILRVPDTFNYKTTPPRPVRLLGLREQSLDYDFARSLGFLALISPMATTVDNKTFFINADQPSAPSPLLAALPKESLAAGITAYNDQPLDFDNIVNGCAFIRDALKTEGKDYDQPMWNLTTLAATFMEHGHALAHRMGKGHSGYTPESTDKLWDRKSKERKDRNIGYPSCAAIQAAGCKACAICPNFAKGKSPLNLGAPVVATAVGGTVTLIAPPDDMFLPGGYIVNSDGFICKLGKDDITLQLFYNKFSNPWVSDEPKALNFTITTDKGHTKDIAIPLADMSNSGKMWDRMYLQGVTPVVHLEAQGRGFMVAWLALIQNAHEAAISVPFGWWHDENGKRAGFAYGGKIFKNDNTIDPSGCAENNMRKWYKPVGTRAAWDTAMKMILAEKRPELECLVAATFAGPLAFVPAEYSSMLSVWGDSGAHKSTAVKVGMAVWSHPLMSKEVARSTANHMMKKMGDLRNLTIYQDDIKDTVDKKDQKGVYTTLFGGTDGIDAGRLTSGVDYRDRVAWQTMVVICSNTSFVDYVNEVNKTSDAGIYRLFEFQHMKGDDNAAGRVAVTMNATRITQELEHNYGAVGMEYAKMLGSNPQEIDTFTRKIVEDFALEVKQTDPERYWVAVCGTLLAGAELANRLGAGLNVPEMRKFLISRYMMNRERCVEANTKGGSQMNTEETLTGFLKAKLGETLWTDIMHQGPGKPHGIQLLHEPDIRFPKPINVHFAVGDRTVTMSTVAFRDYLKLTNTAPAAIVRGLKVHYKMYRERLSMAAGTRHVQGPEAVMIIPIPEGSPLEPLMNAYKQMVKPDAISGATGAAV